MILNVPKLVAIIGVNASNERVYLVPIIVNEFMYKVSLIAIPTIPLMINTNIELRSEKKISVNNAGKKIIEARIFL